MDQVDIYSKNYADAYLELADGIEKRIGEFRDDNHRKFIETQVSKMRIWVEALDKIG